MGCFEEAGFKFNGILSLPFLMSAVNLRKFIMFKYFCYVLGFSLVILLSGCDHLTHQASFDVSETDLSSARQNFKTNIVEHSFQPDGPPDVPPQDILSLIEYPAPDGKMAAYLTPDPKDGKKHPAVIWVHGGYGGIGSFFWDAQPADDDQSARAIREAGIVMLIPSFRGENANPGQYEMFYGEINDLEAALAYLAKLPYVDPDRIYLAGHSTGGTTVLLGNESIKGFRAAFSLGGIPDLKLRIEGGRMKVAVPFDQNDQKEFALRSPRTFIASLKSPTFYFEGEESYWPEFDEIQAVAKNKQAPLQVFEIKQADHFNIITPVTQMIAQKILADTGTQSNIDFSSEDIKLIEQNIPK